MHLCCADVLAQTACLHHCPVRAQPHQLDYTCSLCSFVQADLYTFFREVHALWVAAGQYAGANGRCPLAESLQ